MKKRYFKLPYCLRKPGQGGLQLLVLLWLLLSGQGVRAQTSLASGSTPYSTVAPGTTINVSGGYSGNITILHSGCTVNFNKNYGSVLTVAVTGTNCTINNNSGNNISGNSNRINAATTINNKSGATWSGSFANGGNLITAPLTIINMGTWSGNQLEARNTLALTNSGTLNTTLYGASSSSQTFNLTNSGTWQGQVGSNFAGSLSIDNKNGGSWTPGMALSTLTGFTAANAGTWNTALNSFTVSSPGTAVITNSGTWANNGFGRLTGVTTITNTGTWNNTSVATTGNLTINQQGGTWNGVPDVQSGALTVNNSATWTVGLVFPSGYTNAFNTLVGGTTTFGSGAFVNPRGTTTFQTAGTLSFNNGSTLTLDGATTIATTSGGTTTLASGMTLNQNQAVNFTNSGTLNLNRATSMAGTFTVANNSGGTLNMPAGLSISSSFTNLGTVNVSTLTSSGTLTNSGTINVSSSLINSGTITNRETIAIAGSFTNSGNVDGVASPGRGRFTVTGSSSNSGNFGRSGQLSMCDGSSANGGKFDTQSGIIGPGVAYCTATVAPMPVELTAFSAKNSPGGIMLDWATASETNSDYFAVERSADGYTFATIATLRGQGNSTAPVSYRATDAQPLAGLSYYRLKQVDADGTHAYSVVVTIKWQRGATELSLAPNPTTGSLVVDLTSWAEQPGTLDVLNGAGQVLLSREVPGAGAYPMSLQELQAGIYLLRVRTAQQQLVRRIVKL